jgi:hypothetical protein
MSSATQPPAVAIIGAGPAGLMAAEVLVAGGVAVDLFDAKPSVGRKFLLAGKGGLNLTHSEPWEPFLGRFGTASPEVQPWLQEFDGPALRAWAAGLGVETFVGSSGRVFPSDLKAAPLLRAWLHRLRESGVRLHMRHRWLGTEASGRLRFETPTGEKTHAAQATLLALGGASWPQLGSDGAWVEPLAARGVDVAPLRPANCGFDVGPTQAHSGGPGWSARFATEFAGQPVKPVRLRCTGPEGQVFDRQGEFVITATGVEGSLIYAASAALRDAIDLNGQAQLTLDLLPQHSAEQVLAHTRHARGSRSLSSHLKSRLGLSGLKMGLLHELLSKDAMLDPTELAHRLKALPLTLAAARPVAEAISSAGGVRFNALDQGLMLRNWPGVFCAGEMLDWEAPTGGYLMTASMASGRAAARGVLNWLASRA